MGIQPLAQTLEERIVLPQHETALPVLTEPALFTLHDRLPTVRTDTNDFVFHKRIRSLRSLGGRYQRGDHLFDFSHKSFRFHFAALDLQQFRFPVSRHIRRLDFFGHHGDEGFALVGGQKHLGFLGAFPFQKALLHQLFDGGGSGCRGADALMFYTLRHTVCTSGFHRMK